MKYAVLSMDVEDWYHLDYFSANRQAPSVSMLDGLDEYLSVVTSCGVPSTFFVLGELAEQLHLKLREIVGLGHEVAAHGMHHRRPLTMTLSEFLADVTQCKRVLEFATGVDVQGFRAPCFSMDRARLEQVRTAGYRYDSSRIDFAHHPLYGTLDIKGFREVGDSHFVDRGFHEFEVSTTSVLGRRVPISGGGYLRIFPWGLMKRLVASYAKRSNLYVLYIHPFELSARPMPGELATATIQQRLRFSIGRRSVGMRLRRLIDLLRAEGFLFTTFAELCGACRDN